MILVYPTLIKLLTIAYKHPVLFLFVPFVTLLLLCVELENHNSILAHHYAAYSLRRQTKVIVSAHSRFMFCCRCGKEAVLLETRK